MGNMRIYAAVNTKIRALESLLLKKDDYNNLLESKSLEDMLSKLKSMDAYRESLGDVNLKNVDIEKIEILFKKEIMSKYEKLIYFFNDEYRKFLKTYFMRFEIEDLKLYLRSFIRNEDIFKIKDFIVISGIYGVLDYEKLSKSKSIEDFIDNLKGTEYYRILKYYLDEDPEKMMFYMEMGLDRYYFKKLYKESLKLSSEDKSILVESLGKNSDIQNIQWIYRGLKYYKLSPEELLNYTLSTGYYIKYKKLKELCYIKDIDELYEEIQETKYGNIFRDNEKTDMFFELMMEKYLFKLMVKIQRKHPMSIIDSIIYMHKKEFEMRDIFTLLEVKRYGLPTKDMGKFLIHEI